ncbi:MAG TPA: response regulator, partial [Verrucomicrobiae bacterium]|nr:response regulator [Verrucomicrobiae bacterium]
MPHKLLLADDSITIQKVVGIIFSNEEYELTVVDNGNAALEQARTVVPDVVLADALMPGKNGYDLCREIRRDPRLSHIPTLLMTGVFEPFDENRAKECGADDYITKPFESQQLIEKVRKLIDSARPAAQTPPVAATVAAATAPQPSAAPSQPKPAPTAVEAFDFEEASPEDDLWGAIEVEEETDEEVFFGEEVAEQPEP